MGRAWVDTASSEQIRKSNSVTPAGKAVSVWKAGSRRKLKRVSSSEPRSDLSCAS